MHLILSWTDNVYHSRSWLPIIRFVSYQEKITLPIVWIFLCDGMDLLLLDNLDKLQWNQQVFYFRCSTSNLLIRKCGYAKADDVRVKIIGLKNFDGSCSVYSSLGKSFNASLNRWESKIKVPASPCSQLGVLPGAILMTDFTSRHATLFFSTFLPFIFKLWKKVLRCEVTEKVIIICRVNREIRK